jgi:hypothetical protein
MCFGPDTKISMKTEDLPLVKALHGEDVDDMELFYPKLPKTEGNFVIMSARPLKIPLGKLQVQPFS